MENALCLETGGDPFFSSDAATTRAAKRVCELCEVKYECLEYALADNTLIGVFGGTTERERQKMRKRRKRAQSREKQGVAV